jgi:hemolysin activation/secretion protein
LASQSLPEDLDISQNGLSVESFFSTLDYKFNPRSGYQLRVKLTGGKKTIQRNTSILRLSNNEVDFSEKYAELALNSSRFELLSDFSGYWPLAKRAAIGAHLRLGWRYSNSGLYRNEKFQIGGNKLLRGFDEASFFTSYYGISTLEYRLLLSNNSYFSVPFIDIGLIENPDNQSTIAIGIGSSLGIETKAGLFNFSIAVGRTETLGFDFKRPKAHFGFVSLF